MAQGKAFKPEERDMIIQSIKPYLEMGFSRNKACSLIGLPPQTLSNWVQESEALGILLASWENVLNTIAINNIAQAIKRESELDDDLRKENSWKWAERRMKEDFSLRTEQTGADGKELPTPILNSYVFNNDITKENSTDAKEDTSSTGGDVSIEDNINPIVDDTVIADGQETNTIFNSIGINTTP